MARSSFFLGAIGIGHAGALEEVIIIELKA